MTPRHASRGFVTNELFIVIGLLALAIVIGMQFGRRVLGLNGVWLALFATGVVVLLFCVLELLDRFGKRRH